VEHLSAHLASAFFISPFGEAAVCAIDGFGDFVSRSWAIGYGSTLESLERVYFPDSLGLVYLAISWVRDTLDAGAQKRGHQSQGRRNRRMKSNVYMVSTGSQGSVNIETAVEVARGRVCGGIALSGGQPPWCLGVTPGQSRTMVGGGDPTAGG
jgi:Carbamoyltransferase N-terminus